MPPASNPSQRVLIIGVVIAVCVIAGSSYIAYRFGYGQGLANKAPSQAQGVTTIPVRVVIGSVESVSDQKITLKDPQRVPNTSDAVDQTSRMVVVVGPGTIVERIVQKDAATIRKEREAYLKQTQSPEAKSSGILPIPPESFTREKITLADIKVGDTISAFAGSDITALTTFTALEIHVQIAQKIPTAIPNAQ